MAPPIAPQPQTFRQSPSMKQPHQASSLRLPVSAPTLNVVGTANYSYSTPRNGYQYSGRVDDYIGKNDRIYVDASAA